MTFAGDPVVNDDWDRHWSAFGDAVAGNPATLYRSRLVLKLLEPVADDAVILEIGCGQGEFALHLAQLYPQAEIRGIDASTEGVRRAAQAADTLGLRAHFAPRDLTVPAELSDDEKARATVAVCSEVLEHVDQPDVLLRHAAEYLAPGCRLVITVPGGPRSAFDRHIGHRRHFTAARLRRLLETSGFEQVTVQRAGFPFFGGSAWSPMWSSPRARRSGMVPQGPRSGSSTAPSATTSTRRPSAGNCSPWPTARAGRPSDHLPHPAQNHPGWRRHRPPLVLREIRGGGAVRGH